MYRAVEPLFTAMDMPLEELSLSARGSWSLHLQAGHLLLLAAFEAADDVVGGKLHDRDVGGGDGRGQEHGVVGGGARPDLPDAPKGLPGLVEDGSGGLAGGRGSDDVGHAAAAAAAVRLFGVPPEMLRHRPRTGRVCVTRRVTAARPSASA